MDFSQEDNWIQFLPSVVVNQILNLLDLHDKLKLRLVCKTTNRWVETSTFLKLLEDFPDNPDLIKEHLQTPKDTWNHSRLFIDFRDYPYPFYNLQNLGPIPTLRHLKIKNFSGNVFELKFLSLCSNLESLSIETLDLRGNPQLPVENSVEFSEFFNIFRNLQHLTVGKISIVYPANIELEYFKKLLKLFDSLKTLNVPYYTVKNTVNGNDEDEMEEEIKLSINYAFVIGPIIKYIARRTHLQPQVDNLLSLNLQNFELCFFEIFPELMRTCYKSGTQLQNVNYSLIIKLISMRYDSKLLKVVHSVHKRLVGNANVLLELKNLQSMILDCDQCDLYLPVELSRELYFPQLKELKLCIWSNNTEGDKDEINENVKRVLITRNRSKLRKLTLICEQRNKLLIPVPTICDNFVNLTHLRVETFLKFTNEDFKAITKNLKKLKVLEIDDEWGGISDLGIAAKNQETGQMDIFTLTELVKLRIKARYKYTGAFYPVGQQYKWPWLKLANFTKSPNAHFISDYSFREVFRHMALKSFLVDSADIHVTKLGYQYLVEDCIFAQTIEYFPKPECLPTGLLEEDFYKLRSNFKNFKQKSNEQIGNGNNSTLTEISSKGLQNHCIIS